MRPETALSEAPDIDRIELSEVRDLREAQRGNPAALDALLRRHIAGIWSICAMHHNDDEAAADEVIAFREVLLAQVRRLTVEDPFGVQLYRLLWGHLVHGLDTRRRATVAIPSAEDLIDGVGGQAKTAAQVRDRLRAIDTLPRLIYLFWIVTGLPAPRLAQVIGESEPRVRAARAFVALRLHESGP
jgi:hypothetical protein